MAPSYKKWLNALSFCLLSSSALLWVVLPGMAQESEETEDSSTTEETLCIEEVAIPVMEYYNDVTTFISQHYQSEDPATALLATALLKFDEYEANMNELLLTYNVAYAGEQLDEEHERERDACTNFVQQKIDEVEQLLRNHHLQNAGSKTTFTLVSKLKDINEGLRDMAKDFAEMSTLFKALDSKLPDANE